MYKKILSICMAGAILIGSSSIVHASGGSATSNCPHCHSKGTFTRKCTSKLLSSTSSGSHLTLKGVCKTTTYNHDERVTCSKCGVNTNSYHKAEVKHSTCGKGTEDVCPF